MITFHEFVADSLAQPAGEQVNRYLVVDTAATRPLNVSRSCGLGAAATDVLTGEPCIWRDSAAPVLIPVPSGSSSPGSCQRIRETLGLWRYANCFVYLESPHQPETMRRMLHDRTDALLPQNLPVLLRYFDSRVFSVLMRVLTKKQLESFLDVASRWAWPDRRGNLQVVQPSHLPGFDTLEQPILLDTAQEASLIESGESDAMIDILLNQSNPTLLTLLPPEQFARVDEALACARTLGIDVLTDQVAFCVVALELGLGFVKERPWADGMTALKARQTTFSALVIGAGEDAPT